MILGVPTLTRYDLLDELIRSVEAGTLLPSGYVIQDNGEGYPAARARALIERDVGIFANHTGKNIGVAASWNFMIEEARGQSVCITNDDIVFAPDTFENLAKAVVDYPFVASDGFACFAITEECVKTVGWFDENFYPAYFEDVDYHYRMRLTGVRSIGVPPPASHGGSSTVRSVSPEMRAMIDNGYRLNSAYYARKWGGRPGEEIYKIPFGGNPPPDWTEHGAP